LGLRRSIRDKRNELTAWNRSLSTPRQNCSAAGLVPCGGYLCITKTQFGPDRAAYFLEMKLEGDSKYHPTGDVKTTKV
jgi:hypothetical protein